MERLREKARRRAIAAARIVEPVRAELDLALEEVEVGRAREAAISSRLIAPARPCHQTAKFTA